MQHKETAAVNRKMADSLDIFSRMIQAVEESTKAKHAAAELRRYIDEYFERGLPESTSIDGIRGTAHAYEAVAQRWLLAAELYSHAIHRCM